MFTGIIEKTGVVASSAGPRLAIRAPGLGLGGGDSLAVNGACLSLAGRKAGALLFDMGPETRRVTNLGRLRPGSRVNLERPLRFGAALGGHLVSGHVDSLARLLKKEALPGGFARLVVERPKDLRGLIAPKGSVVLDGVSLTVVSAAGSSFEVMLVPATLERTTLGGYRPGALLNLEADLLARYVQSALREMPR